MAGDLSEYDPTLDDPGQCPRMPFCLNRRCTCLLCTFATLPQTSLCIQQYPLSLQILPFSIFFNHVDYQNTSKYDLDHFCGQSWNPQIALIQTSDSTRHAPLRHSCLYERDTYGCPKSLQNLRYTFIIHHISRYKLRGHEDLKKWKANERNSAFLQIMYQKLMFFPDHLGIWSR